MSIFGQASFSVDLFSIFREALLGEKKWGLINQAFAFTLLQAGLIFLFTPVKAVAVAYLLYFSTLIIT